MAEADGTSDVIGPLPPKYYLGRRGSVPDAKLVSQGANSGSGLRKNYGLIQKLGFGSRLAKKRGSDAGLESTQQLLASKPSLQSPTSQQQQQPPFRQPPPQRKRAASVDFGISHLSLVSPTGAGAGPTIAIYGPPLIVPMLRSSLEDIHDVDNEVQVLTEDDGSGSGSSENVSRRLMVHQPPGTVPYTVNSTDTLSAIAARCKTTTSELTKINRLMSPMIFPGQNLFIPGEDYTPVTYRSLTPQPPRHRVNSESQPQQQQQQTTLRPDSGELFQRPRASSWNPFDDDGNIKAANDKISAAKKDAKQKKKKWLDRRKSTDDGRKVASTENLVPSTTSLFSGRVQYATNTADRALIDGTLTFGGDTMTFEPDFSSGRSAVELIRYRLSLNRSTITATMYNSLPSSGKPATVYRRPAVAMDEKRREGVVDDEPKSDAADVSTSGKTSSNSSLDKNGTGSPDAVTENGSGDVKYLSIKLGFSSQAIEERPAIGSLIKSLMPKVIEEIWIEHDFVIPADRVVELDGSLAIWLAAETAAEQDEKRDVVDADLKLGDKKKTPNRPFRRTLSAAELYNIPLPDLSHPSNVIGDSHIHALRENLPARADGRPWVLVYSSERDGFSLGTLYRRMDGFNCPTLLVVQDTTFTIFGAVSLCPLQVSEGFYGSGEMFLFTFHPVFTKYSWSGRNSYFIRGTSGSLSVGASDGAFGLWLDDNLYRGRTQRCDTFDNEPLTSSPTDNDENSSSSKQDVDFTIKCVEVWAFV